MGKPKHPKCRGCGMRLDHRRHRNKTEALCLVLNDKAIRSRARPRVRKISEVYEGGSIKSEFIGSDMEDKLMERQRKLALDAILGLGENGYYIPRNIRHFSDQGFVVGQVATKRPWAVYVLADGKRKRKRCNNIFEAVTYHKAIYKKFPNSGVVSLARSYDLPDQYRLTKEKLPKRFKWCPHCADFRVYKRVEPQERFYAQVKIWSETKGRYVWTDRYLWLTECQLCGITNRSAVFRRSNQPWEKRKIKQGVKRVKPRVSTKRRRVNRKRKMRL